MTMKQQIIRVSKFLSYLLRHQPEEIGLTLDESGWADVDELISKSNAHGKNLTRSLLEEVVRTNSKQRFALSENGTRIRANQGHSIKVDLKLEPTAPPNTLYHGTVKRFMDSILTQGLKPGKRHHVHLSADATTAEAVGQRRGKPIILTIDAKQMHQDGVLFYRSENEVWLVDAVPPHYFIKPK